MRIYLYVCFYILCAVFNIYNAYGFCCNEASYTPSNTIIAFDLHGVIFKSNRLNMACGALKLLYNGMWRFVVNKQIFVKVKELAKTGMPEEAIFNSIAQQYPELLKYKADFIALSNEQYVIPQVEHILNRLKRAGYKLYVLTNLGREAYEHLVQKYEKVFSLFDGSYMPDNSNEYSYKPQEKFFQNFKDYITKQEHAEKNIVFVDDKKENIDAACDLNIIGVQFISVEQLENYFDYMGILNK